MRPNLPYEDWKKELQIWSRFTDLDQKKQGGAVFLTLSGKARETVLAEVAEDEYDKDTILKKITASLDTLYLKDTSETAYIAFDNFIKFRRPQNMSIQDFMGEFNLRYSKIKVHKMVLPDGVLAYAVLTCANLPDDQAQICRATVATLTFDLMRKQIEKVTLDSNKTESVPVFYAKDSDYAQPQSHPHSYEHVSCSGCGAVNGQDCECQEEELYHDDELYAPGHASEEHEFEDTYYGYSRPPYAQRAHVSRGGGQYQRPYHRASPNGGNAVDESGYPLTCRFCKSTYHLVRECPHAPPHFKSDNHRFPGHGRPGRGGYRGRGRARGYGGNQNKLF